MRTVYIWLSLALALPLAAQTINPNQIRPATVNGYVLTTVTANNPPSWQPAGGLCPGGSTFSLQYNAGGGVCGGDTAVTDGAGNIYSPNGSFTTTASYQGAYMFGEGSGAITVPAHAPTNFVSWAGPTSGTIALWLDFFGTAPTVPWAFTFATPATVNSRSHSQAAATPLTSFPLFGVPPCTGFTPTNGQAIEYTTASSPNPCYTAATPGGFTAGGDLSGSSTSQEVIGLNTVPFCSGFTPTNGEAVTYSTGLSPNPCYTAATPSGGGGFNGTVTFTANHTVTSADNGKLVVMNGANLHLVLPTTQPSSTFQMWVQNLSSSSPLSIDLSGGDTFNGGAATPVTSFNGGVVFIAANTSVSTDYQGGTQCANGTTQGCPVLNQSNVYPVPSTANFTQYINDPNGPDNADEWVVSVGSHTGGFGWGNTYTYPGLYGDNAATFAPSTLVESLWTGSGANGPEVPNGKCWLLIASGSQAAPDAALCDNATGLANLGNGSSSTDSSAGLKLGYVEAGGTQTISGCSLASAVGGMMAGSFASGTSGTCTVVITPGATAPHGWRCSAADLTTPADTLPQTATSATTCTISGTTVSGDAIVWGPAVAY